jgi:hypothetical protein
MADCKEIRELISAYLDCELTEADSLRVRAHIEGCADCYNLLNIYGDISSSIKGSLADAPESLSAGVMAKIRSGEADSDRMAEKRRRTLRIVMTRYLPVAACLAIILPAIVYLVGSGGMLNTSFDSSLRAGEPVPPMSSSAASPAGSANRADDGNAYINSDIAENTSGDAADIWDVAANAPVPAPDNTHSASTQPPGSDGYFASSAPSGGDDPKNAYDNGNGDNGAPSDADRSGDPAAPPAPHPERILIPRHGR